MKRGYIVKLSGFLPADPSSTDAMKKLIAFIDEMMAFCDAHGVQETKITQELVRRHREPASGESE